LEVSLNILCLHVLQGHQLSVLANDVGHALQVAYGLENEVGVLHNFAHVSCSVLPQTKRIGEDRKRLRWILIYIGDQIPLNPNFGMKQTRPRLPNTGYMASYFGIPR
jgi:hypothetical protein